MAKNKTGLPTADSKSEIVLTGFYITPFGKKKVSTQGHGAVKQVQSELDFDEVAGIVIDAVSSAQHRTAAHNYSFQLRRHAVKAKYLDDSIMMNISAADFVVTDWTTMNPNVLLEAGFAHGRAKHGIHLSADGSFPSDRAGIIYVHYDPTKLQVLSSNLSGHIPALVDQIEKGPWVFDYHSLRSTDLVRRMIRESTRDIRILQTNLETVNTNHLPDLDDALKRGVQVRILTLDPQSRYVNERALQLGYKNETIKVYRDGLQNAIDNTSTHLDRFKNFRLRLYNDFPNQLTYIFDDRVLASIISRTGRSRDNCVFHLPSHRLPGATHTFVDHFNQLWDTTVQEIARETPSRSSEAKGVKEPKPAKASKRTKSQRPGSPARE